MATKLFRTANIQRFLDITRIILKKIIAQYFLPENQQVLN